MNPTKRYLLCPACVAEGQKHYDVILTYWQKKMKIVCDRCDKECYGAEYRLQEKDAEIDFCLGAYDYNKKR